MGACGFVSFDLIDVSPKVLLSVFVILANYEALFTCFSSIPTRENTRCVSSIHVERHTSPMNHPI